MFYAKCLHSCRKVWAYLTLSHRYVLMYMYFLLGADLPAHVAPPAVLVCALVRLHHDHVRQRLSPAGPRQRVRSAQLPQPGI
jgi:hypothetical protein